VLFFLLNVFLNYDTGVLPAGLIQIQEELNINNEQMAYLGSFVYIGLCIATLFGSFIFNHVSAGLIIAIMVILNSVCCYVFILTDELMILYSLRLALGFTQAFVVIHGPVWVNEYSPPENSSKWLAMLHSAVIVGILSGYVTTAIFENYFSEYLGWKNAIELQAYAQLVLGLIMFCVSSKDIDLDTSSEETLKLNENEEVSDAEDSSQKLPSKRF